MMWVRSDSSPIQPWNLKRFAKHDAAPGSGTLPLSYRPASAEDVPAGRACGNCVFYVDETETRGRWCRLWDTGCAADHYCDAWEPVGVAKHGGSSHDQLSHGSWAGESVGRVIEGHTADTVREGAISGEGISLNFHGEGPKTGYMVSHAGTEVVLSDEDFQGEKGRETIRQYVRQHAERLRARTAEGSAKNYLGLWLDDGKWYLDLSENVSTLREAVVAGRDRNQLAVWDVEGNRPIAMDSSEADEILAKQAPFRR